MKRNVSRKEAANVQIDWAIRLILDYRSYIPAVTLAGAAEEILCRDFKQESAHGLLKKQIAEKLNISEKVVSDSHLNYTKNLFKHWPIQEDEISIELETDVVQYVFRTLTNMIKFDASIPSQASRFIKWLDESQSDLVDQDFLNDWKEMLTRIGEKY